MIGALGEQSLEKHLAYAQVTYKNIKFQVWDLGGQTSIRPYWRCYYPK